MMFVFCASASATATDAGASQCLAVSFVFSTASLQAEPYIPFADGLAVIYLTTGEHSSTA